MRRVTVERNTSESQIKVTLDLDGTGVRTIDTQLPFFTHMLDAFARHGLYDLELFARGDVEVDAHHVVEDVGLVLGDAFAQALGDKRGIRRYGECTVPMDETLAQAVVDFSGRPHLVWKVDGTTPPRRGSMREASSAARAKALNSASMMWWAFSP